ncbi:recombinase family protein [Niallia sp.]|uniref:recombinase family protein n=1 Tax=Niallia sp. TaxID=2837523 RepID=UPI0028A0CC45|nr:recombinase family protein [Niallia sp.]
MEFAYARVSTRDQNLERQLIKFKEMGIPEENTFVDKSTGKNFDREGYRTLKERLQEGDSVFLDALDRLGRDYDLIIQEWKDITRRIGADIVILENKELFDSRKFKAMGDMGKLLEDQLLTTLAFVSDQERKKLLERQREGIALAKAAGKYNGKPKKYTVHNGSLMHAIELYKEGKKTVKEITNITKISRSSFYEYIKEHDIKRNCFS